ncbi:MAG: AAA family ATPase [Burkholderia sp.]|jgi:predicted ATPase/signal transduction histidine kinase|uniref:trifunctional serine/threonine-protein kinase/ATP-binding protein/sensor histidine kinase n=1 Tax=Burkholderia sp. TaxID=36773 RepID=UPI0028218764|nr:ATP-binding protein [Burkholderia sp.]MDR0243335.1 AAA family ATPase [Burkholderia sp.]
MEARRRTRTPSAQESILNNFNYGPEDIAHAKLILLREGPVQLYRALLQESTVLAAVPVNSVSEASLEQLRYEFSIGDKFNGDFALCPLRFAAHNQSPALLLGDPGGQILMNLMNGAMPARVFIRHALPLARSVAAAHEAGLVHGGLTPSNIMVHPSERRAWLTGFRPQSAMPTLTGVASRIPREIDPGLLHYMAPEASGRVNRISDERSDLYSLGCIFFHMLTGRVLFPGLTPSEEIHAHLARRPDEDALLELKQKIGEHLVQVVSRMIAKEPAERYQRAVDVVSDLVAIGSARSSQPATTERRHMSGSDALGNDGLIGRQAELERLRSAVQGRSEDQDRKLWLVEGPPGIGKSALVHHLTRQIGGEGCEVVHGKCELGDGVTPYASLARALSALARTALAYPPHHYDVLLQRLREALIDDASLVTTVFPDFARILGLHAHKPAVFAHAERPRFLDAIAKLLGAFACRERPLLLFLDDLQWVDEGTLEVIKHVMQNPLCRHVLIVAAMRDRNVENQGAHVAPFISTTMVERIPLTPLSEREVGGLLRAILADEIRNHDLVEDTIHRSAGGNPLDTIQFVRSLIDHEVIVYDDAYGEWVASLPEIERRSGVASVVDLLSARVATLDEIALLATQYLAILAEPSTLDVLASAMSGSRVAIEIALREPLEQQLIALNEGLYSFTHDRVRDAVLQTLTDLERTEKHLEVGSRLWRDVKTEGLTVGAFVVANHLNKGARHVPEHRRRDFALTNLEAAMKAKAATAYESAISYLASSCELLKGRAHADGDLLSIIELKRGECEFLCMRVKEGARRLAAIATDRLDSKNRADLIRLRLAMYVTLDQPETAVDVGFRYLEEEAGIALPVELHPTSVDDEYRRFLQLYGSRDVDELMTIDLMVDERIRNAMDVMTDLIPPVQFTSQELVELLILRMVNLSLEHGHCDASCYAYVALSFVTAGRYRDFATTAVFSQLSMRLPRERGLTLYAGRVQMCFGALGLPWSGPAADARHHLEEATELTSRQGDLTFAVYSRRHTVANLLFSGASLLEAQQVAEDGLKLARDAGFALVIDAFMAQAWLIRELRGVPVDIGLLESNVDYIELLDDCISGKFHRHIAAFAFWTYRLQAAYLWGDMSEALMAEERAAAAMWASPAFLENVDFVFYSGLLRIALARTTTGHDRRTHSIHASERIDAMRRWAQACPQNFLSRLKLLEAEFSALMGEKVNSLVLYEEAITVADQARDMHIQSVARELTSHFSGRCGLRSAQQGYREQARKAYACWGADAKVRHLDTDFPATKTGKLNELRDPDNVPIWSEDRFDTEIVLRSIRALSGEISLQQVLQTILQNALEYAGAERAVLCLIEDGTLCIAAQGKLVKGELEIDISRKPVSAELMATPVAYLTMRSKESVVLEDARNDPQHGFDSYVRTHRSRSIMCVPLVKQGSLTGLLYLENGLIAAVFNATRVRTLEVLASQAAVSLENAKLYESVEAEHKRRAEAERHVRETQEELSRAARLTELGELAAFIVHEVSQPITAVGTCARTAIRWLSREIPNLKEAVVALEKISASSVRAKNIIESIRAMVRESPPNMSGMDVHEAILEVFGVLQERISSEGVKVSHTFETDSLMVVGDRILLQQVIMNLMINSLEAMSDIRGEKAISIRTQTDGDLVYVTVNDTGRGIADEIADHIFESLATTKGNGMGMGLSICKSIVEAHGGKIEVCSRVPVGTSFRFSVPIGQ